MPSNANFSMARAATMQAARDLYGVEQRAVQRRPRRVDRRGGELMRAPRAWAWRSS